MTLNRTDLKKIIYDFNSISNRLLQADFNDYLDVLTKFISFLVNTPIIYDYIVDCGSYDGDLEAEVNEVRSSYGRLIFSVGDTEQEEVRNVFAVLQCIVEKRLLVHLGVAEGYSTSNLYQDKVKGFNERFVMILIRHIEGYLTKVGIDMGLDDKKVFNVSVHSGQAIIAMDNATVTATNTVGLDPDRLAELIAAVRDASTDLSEEDAEAVEECLDVVATEAASDKPKKSILKAALTTLKGIVGAAEFSAAVITLIQFVQTLL